MRCSSKARVGPSPQGNQVVSLLDGFSIQTTAVTIPESPTLNPTRSQPHVAGGWGLQTPHAHVQAKYSGTGRRVLEPTPQESSLCLQLCLPRPWGTRGSGSTSLEHPGLWVEEHCSQEEGAGAQLTHALCCQSSQAASASQPQASTGKPGQCLQQGLSVDSS